MILQSTISDIIDSQLENFTKKETGLEREILNTLPIIPNFALVITGLRRCGKSTLLYQILKTRIPDAVYLNFEDPRFAGFDISDFSRLGIEISKRNKKTIFLDEIQLIENWEVFVRQKLDEDYLIIITGSNAHLLSKELGTKLTGRHLSVELFPFSYHEFLSFEKTDSSEQSFNRYMRTGGIPEYVKTNNGLVLNSLFNDIIIRDIAVRHGIRDISSLKQIAVYLISNIGKPVTAKSMLGLFHIKANSTVLEYFSHLEDSYLIQFLPVFSYSLKAQMRNPRKVYSIDMGIFTENSITFTEENGRRLENLIFLHLRRKYKDLYYYSDKNECDFVALEKGNAVEIIQVCYELNDLNFTREFNGLLEAMAFFKSTNGKIITYQQNDLINKNDKIIEVVAAHIYLEQTRY